jgi:hypothetical protein
MRVRTTDTRIDPRHPRRFEKKMNGICLALWTGAAPSAAGVRSDPQRGGLRPIIFHITLGICGHVLPWMQADAPPGLAVLFHG